MKLLNLIKQAALFTLLTCMLIGVYVTSVLAAPLRNVPVTVTQPDGTELSCLASGDEFFNYLHDAEGNIIIQSPTTGYYTYAELDSSKKLVPSNNIAKSSGEYDEGFSKMPRNMGTTGVTFEDIDFSANQDLIRDIPSLPEDNEPSAFRMPIEPYNSVGIKGSTVRGIMENVIVMICFSDENNAIDSTIKGKIDGVFNTAEASLKTYTRAVSENVFEINSTLVGLNGATVLMYKDSNPRAYYKPYNAVTNPIGYATNDNPLTGERAQREHKLLKDTVDAIDGSALLAGKNLDINNDSYIDSITFIISGSPGGWSDLLWPHKWQNHNQQSYLNGKRVWTYSFQLANSLFPANGSSNLSVICHEALHTFSFPDLYRYTNNGNPVGYWDIMASNYSNPQIPNSHSRLRYAGWGKDIVEITANGRYTLNPIGSTSGVTAYALQTTASNQFILLEYRDEVNPTKYDKLYTDNPQYAKGLTITRINTLFEGNANNSGTTDDEVYVYAPSETALNKGNANIDDASLSLNRSRTSFGTSSGSGLSGTIYLYEGTNTNYVISNVSSAIGTISFDVQLTTPSSGNTISFVSGNNGTLSAQYNSLNFNSGGTVAANSSVVFTATPAANYIVDEWLVDGQVQVGQTTNTFTLSNITAAHTVMVTFKQDPTKIVAKPVITTNPADVSAVANNATVNVTITTSTPGASIYYTTNGSTPTTGSNLYSNAFPVTAGSTESTSKRIITYATKGTDTPSQLTYIDISFLAATPTYVATVNIKKDGNLWANSGKTVSLQKASETATSMNQTGTTGAFTATVEAGTWKVLVDGADTGRTIVISDTAASVDVQYYTIQFSVTNAGTASGSTISATYNGSSISTNSVVLGGKDLVISAVGAGATDGYSYAWTGSGTSGQTTASITIIGVSAAVNASCTITGLVNAATPTFSTNLSGTDTYNQNVAATALSVLATITDSGLVTYQWYSNTANNTTSGTPISGATGVNYTPPTTTVGTTYYYVIATNTNNSVSGVTTATTTSGIKTVVVNSLVNAATPTFSTNLSGTDTYNQNVAATALSVLATITDSGLVTYQWYSNTDNNTTSGTPISGATGVNYTPPTTTVGTTYYYVIATNTNNSVSGVTTATATSGIKTVVVNSLVNAATPTFSTNLSGTDTYNQNGAATALSVLATITDSGLVTYQWYSNTANNTTSGTAISGATGVNYTPPTTTVGTTYYYVIATNTNNSVSGVTTATATSGIKTVTVTASVIYSISATPQNLNFNSFVVGYTTPSALTITITNTGNQAVTLIQPTTAGTLFSIGNLNTTSLMPGNTVSFTVTPVVGLPVGNYNEVIAVNTTNNTGATISVHFSVTQVTVVPSIITSSLANGVLGTPYSETIIAAGTAPITWTITSGMLPAGLTLQEATGIISGTPLSVGLTSFTVQAVNGQGSDVRSFDLTVSNPSNNPVVTFHPNGGLGMMLPQAFIPQVAQNLALNSFYRTNYSFAGWNTSPSGGGTSYQDGQNIVLTSDLSLYAQWTYLPYVSSAGTSQPETNTTSTPTVTPATVYETIEKVTNSTATKRQDVSIEATILGKGASKTYTPVITVTVQDGSLSVSLAGKGVDKMIQETSAATQSNGEKANIQFNLITAEQFRHVDVTIPNSKISDVGKLFNGMTLQTRLATLTFDSKAVTSITNATKDDVHIKLDVVDTADLSDELRVIVGNNPVYDFTITSGDKTISSFGSGMATISIPYALASGEKPENVIIYYINDNGALEIIKNCHYDEQTGMASFSTNHFSKYAAAVKIINFSDVRDSKWYSRPVAFVTARELFSGVGGNQFAPDSTMTRAMFISVLSRLEDSAANNNWAMPFDDVSLDDWYGKPIAWASAKKLINSDNVIFNPSEPITREEMALILYQYVCYKQLVLPVVSETTFADMTNVSNEAKEAVTYMKKYGLIDGVGSNQYAPQQTATRAQVAQIFMNVIRGQNIYRLFLTKK